MASNAWKDLERATAKLLGGTRGITKGFSAPDVEHEFYSIECKHRKKLPALIISAYAQAKSNAKGTEKIPLVVFHEAGSSLRMVILDIKDFIKLTAEGEIE